MCCDDSCSDHCRVVFCNITPFKNAAKDSLPCPDNTNKFILFRGKYYIYIYQGHLFVAVVWKSRNLQFSATNREIGVFPRRTAKSTIFRDKSRYNLFSATDHEISCLCKLKFRSLDLFQRNLTKRYKI